MILKKLIEKNKTVIITSHIIESLTTICDSISLLKEGKICNTYYHSEFDVLTRTIHTEVGMKYNEMIEKLLL